MLNYKQISKEGKLDVSYPTFLRKQYGRYFTLFCYLRIDLRTVRKTVSKIKGAELYITRSEVGLLIKNGCTIWIRTLRTRTPAPLPQSKEYTLYYLLYSVALPTRPWFTRTLAIHFIHEKSILRCFLKQLLFCRLLCT